MFEYVLEFEVEVGIRASLGVRWGGGHTQVTQRHLKMRHAVTCRQATGPKGLLAALPTGLG